MGTYGGLISETRYLLRSFTGQHDRTTYLTADAAPGDLTLSVNDGGVVNRGTIEIGSELMWVDSSSGGTLALPPFGRGYQGSTAAAHASGDQVLVDPTFPTIAIQQALLETAQAVYPALFRVKSTEFSYSPAKAAYEAPADCDRVLSITFQTLGPSGYWQPIERYRLDTSANTTAFTTGRALHILQSAAAGRTVRVLYAAPFDTFTDEADTLASVGLEESHRDVLVFGAAARLIQYLEPGRLSMQAVENAERAKYAPTGAASALTRQLLSWYEQRLSEERRKLLDRYPVNRSFRNW